MEDLKADKLNEPQLKYPIDTESVRALAQASDKYLLDKVFELLWRKIFRWQTRFESLDGFDQTGVGGGAALFMPVPLADRVELQTTAAVPSSIVLEKGSFLEAFATFAYKSKFRTQFLVEQVTSQTAYMVVGWRPLNPFYGFKIVDGNLYGVCSNGTSESTVLLQAISADTRYNIEARFFPSEKVLFLVDGIQRGSITDLTYVPRVPSGGFFPDRNLVLMHVKLENGDATARQLWISSWDYIQQMNITN